MELNDEINYLEIVNNHYGITDIDFRINSCLDEIDISVETIYSNHLASINDNKELLSHYFSFVNSAAINILNKYLDIKNRLLSISTNLLYPIFCNYRNSSSLVNMICLYISLNISKFQNIEEVIIHIKERLTEINFLIKVKDNFEIGRKQTNDPVISSSYDFNLIERQLLDYSCEKIENLQNLILDFERINKIKHFNLDLGSTYLIYHFLKEKSLFNDDFNFLKFSMIFNEVHKGIISLTIHKSPYNRQSLGYFLFRLQEYYKNESKLIFDKFIEHFFVIEDLKSNKPFYSNLDSIFRKNYLRKSTVTPHRREDKEINKFFKNLPNN